MSKHQQEMRYNISVQLISPQDTPDFLKRAITADRSRLNQMDIKSLNEAFLDALKRAAIKLNSGKFEAVLEDLSVAIEKTSEPLKIIALKNDLMKILADKKLSKFSGTMAWNLKHLSVEINSLICKHEHLVMRSVPVITPAYRVSQETTKPRKIVQTESDDLEALQLTRAFSG